MNHPIVIPELAAFLRRVRLGRHLETVPKRVALVTTSQTRHAETLELVLADEASCRETISVSLRAHRRRLDPAVTLGRVFHSDVVLK